MAKVVMMSASTETLNKAHSQGHFVKMVNNKGDVFIYVKESPHFIPKTKYPDSFDGEKWVKGERFADCPVAFILSAKSAKALLESLKNCGV